MTQQDKKEMKEIITWLAIGLPLMLVWVVGTMWLGSVVGPWIAG